MFSRNTKTRRQWIVVMGLLCLGLSSARQHVSAGDDEKCAHCGCRGACQKICRCVPEEKKVQVTLWGMACDEACLPGHSCPSCKHCEEIADDSTDPKAPSSCPKLFTWTEWIPGCAKTVVIKKKLMKKVVTKTIPGHKWIVETVCDACAESACNEGCIRGSTPPATTPATIPTAPLPTPVK